MLLIRVVLSRTLLPVSLLPVPLLIRVGPSLTRYQAAGLLVLGLLVLGLLELGLLVVGLLEAGWVVGPMIGRRFDLAGIWLRGW